MRAERVKNDLSRELGVTIEELQEMDFEEAERLIEARTGKKVSYRTDMGGFTTIDEINANIDSLLEKERGKRKASTEDESE